MYMSCDVAREGQKRGGGTKANKRNVILVLSRFFFFSRTSDKSISSTRFCSIANTFVISWLRENDTESSADVSCALGRLIYLAKRKSVWINNWGKGKSRLYSLECKSEKYGWFHEMVSNFPYLTVEERWGFRRIPPKDSALNANRSDGFFFSFSQSLEWEREEMLLYIFLRKTKEKKNPASLSVYFFFSPSVRPHFAGKSRTGQRRIELLSLHYIFALYCQSRVESTPAPHTHTHTIIQ